MTEIIEDYGKLDAMQKDEIHKAIKAMLTPEPKPYINCPYYQKCEDQVCPMDPLKENRIWYSHEGQCLNPEYKGTLMAQSKKKISKKHAPGYFTYAMLDRDMIIRKGVEGIDPDVPDNVLRRGQHAVDSLYREREKAWLSGHSEITGEQKERMRLDGIKKYEALKSYMEGNSK